MKHLESLQHEPVTKSVWVKPVLNIISVAAVTLGGATGSDDGQAGLS